MSLSALDVSEMISKCVDEKLIDAHQAVMIRWKLIELMDQLWETRHAN